MKKILAFSGSNSASSINQKLVSHVAGFAKKAEVTTIDLREFPLPLYGMDIEQNEGLPENVFKLKEIFDAHDGYIISVPEHNSSMTAMFKNTIDWLSRIEMRVFQGKPILLMSATPGPGGGRNGLAQTEKVVSGYLAGKVIDKIYFGEFRRKVNMNGSIHEITDDAARHELETAIANLETRINQGG